MDQNFNRLIQAPQGYEFHSALMSGDAALAAVFHRSVSGKFYGIGFSGRRKSPDFNLRFRDLNSLEKYAAEFLTGVKARAEKRERDRADRKAWIHDCRAGDVFSCSWGYDQTNVDYWVVTRVIGKSVYVKKLGKQSSGSWNSIECVPDLTKEIGEERRMVPQRGYNGEPYLAVYSFANAYRVKTREVGGVKVYPIAYASETH